MDTKWESIAALDLQSVREKLMLKKGWWWRLWADVGRLELEYRQFLYLIAVNPGQTVVPWSRDLDEFWHEHILDTDKYAKDCDALFGTFIHHNPHLPIGTAWHRVELNNTRRMYRSAFKDKAGAGPGCSASMPVVFCGTGGTDGSGHHGGSHGDAGHSSGHGDGGHGGHSCSGHSCSGGHGCGGHGCGGH